jgi:hypothetical protein
VWYKLANDGQDTRAVQHYLGHKSASSPTFGIEFSVERWRLSSHLVDHHMRRLDFISVFAGRIPCLSNFWVCMRQPWIVYTGTAVLAALFFLARGTES